ncbi:MAG: DUF262 domain-containing protein [Taibaiella sp.]|nr:DUF262 domain-containing protein [Taibaiella sp.]
MVGDSCMVVVGLLGGWIYIVAHVLYIRTEQIYLIEILKIMDNRKVENPIKVLSISLFDLLNMPLSIPEYQRPYVWTSNDIDKLLNQITNYKKGNGQKPMFYIGSVVLHDNGSTLDIIDGQQRITTMMLINHIKCNAVYEMTYQNLVSHNNIKNNINYISNLSIEELNFDEINVTVVITKSQDEAYNFFETLNTGGKRLTGIDILKAHHLRRIKDTEMDAYAVLWEKEQKYIEPVVKLLLKARKWNCLNFSSVPNRKAGLDKWKEVITTEFSFDTLKSGYDIAYSFLRKLPDGEMKTGADYAARQPLSDGSNFIKYMFEYIKIYKDIFVNFEHLGIEYSDLQCKIISRVDGLGTVDLKNMYQLLIICYVSRFGEVKITEAALWLFRLIYSNRVTADSRLQESTVVKFNENNKIVDRVFALHSEDELIEWLKKYSYTPVNTNLQGRVKGRYVDVIKTHFGFEMPQNDMSTFDGKLKESIENKIKKFSYEKI